MNRKAVLVILLAVAVSGCVDGETGPATGSSDKGSLEIVKYDISDSQLAPGQQARIDLLLKNYHRGDIEINDLSLYNTAFLEVSDKSCTPETIQSADEDYKPQMECSWIVSAPEDMSGFPSRSVTIQLNLKYDSEVSNRDSPVQVQFRPSTEIRERSQHEQVYSNGEVEVAMSYENPLPSEGGIAKFRITPKGPGSVLSNYSMTYRPSTVFQDCDTEIEPVVSENEASFACEIGLEEGSSSTRNLVFSTSYKYVKSPSLDIEVAKP